MTRHFESSFDVGDTAVVCRPHQVQEAAIVVSCLPPDRFTPVLPIAAPPMTEAEFVELHHLARQASADVMAQVGTELGRRTVVTGSQATRQHALALMDRQDQLDRQMGPYRSWLKHNDKVAKLVSALGIRKVVFLDDFDVEELNTIDPVFRDELSERWRLLTERDDDDPVGQMFTKIPDQLRLRCDDLSSLTDTAWRFLRGGTPTPEQAIEIGRHDRSGAVAALFAALRTGAVLRVVDTPRASFVGDIDAINPESTEAVLVENTEDVDALLGAVYAHHRDAPLVIIPSPDLEQIQAAVDEQQRRIVHASRAADRDLRGTAFLETVRRVLSGEGRNMHRTLEEVVTAQVPQSAIAAVGDRRLTAFTSGVPYNFVRTGPISWAQKVIGHVPSDPDLIILNELYSEGAERSAGAFGLVFDAGFFDTSETDDVVAAVRAHSTHPILLTGSERLLLNALMGLPAKLPVEFMFFNTHGEDDGIVLGETFSLKSWLIPQLFMWDHRPIIFNNSCQSWTGVGREFIRVGARGYIGSLWSVPSNLAADFGRVVMNRLTTGETLAAEAIVSTGLPAGIERSYIYVGTANGRLDQWGDRAGSLHEVALAEYRMLADAVDPEQQELSQVLRTEMAELREKVFSVSNGYTLEFLDLLIAELRMAVNKSTPDEEINRRFKQIEAVRMRLDLPRDVAAPRFAAFFELTGRWAESRGDRAQAIKSFQRSVDFGDDCENRPSILLRMADLHLFQGEREEALKAAQLARSLYLDQNHKVGVLHADKALCSLSVHSDDGAALRYATEGYRLAESLGETRLQAEFKLNEAEAHRTAGDLERAIAAATESMKLARTNQDDRWEITALGRLASYCRANGDLQLAEQHSRTCIAFARRIGEPTLAVPVYLDLGETLVAGGKDGEAVKIFKLAMSETFEMRAWDGAALAIRRLSECGKRTEDADALWFAAMFGTGLCAKAPQKVWSGTLPVVVRSFLGAIEVGTFAMTEQRIGDVGDVLTALPPERREPHMKLLLDIYGLLLFWMTRQRDRAELMSFARHLDRQVTGGDLGLEAFVSLPYSQRARNHGIQVRRP